jgi:DNA-binding NarL/FixJ family response regulator
MQRLQTFLVEDSPLIRQDLSATLEEVVGLDVIGFAEDEAGALAWLEGATAPPELVITDIFLKGKGSGLGVLSALRLQALRPTVVVLTNYASDHMRQRCLDLGADRVFDKSHEIDALLDYCAALARRTSLPKPGLQ